MIKSAFIITILLFALRFDNGTITNVQDNNVTVVTSDGEQWDFEGTGYTKGDNVTIAFDTQGTSTIYDDSIIGTK